MRIEGKPECRYLIALQACLKITPMLYKLLEYKRNWIQHVNRMPRNTQGNETLFPNWQKESWQTFEETSGCVRSERVNKWPNSMTDIWWWWWWWWHAYNSIFQTLVEMHRKTSLEISNGQIIVLYQKLFAPPNQPRFSVHVFVSSRQKSPNHSSC
jgi:hypothetical protein